jgi:hypothetical protein
MDRYGVLAKEVEEKMENGSIVVKEIETWEQCILRNTLQSFTREEQILLTTEFQNQSDKRDTLLSAKMQNSSNHFSKEKNKILLNETMRGVLLGAGFSSLGFFARQWYHGWTTLDTTELQKLGITPTAVSYAEELKEQLGNTLPKDRAAALRSIIALAQKEGYANPVEMEQMTKAANLLLDEKINLEDVHHAMREMAEQIQGEAKEAPAANLNAQNMMPTDILRKNASGSYSCNRFDNRSAYTTDRSKPGNHKYFENKY